MNGRYWFIGDQLILNWMLNNNRLLHGKLSQITICEDDGYRHTGDASISPLWLRWSLAQERSCMGFCEVQVNKLLSRKLSRAVSWINMDLDGWMDGWIAWGIEQHEKEKRIFKRSFTLEGISSTTSSYYETRNHICIDTSYFLSQRGMLLLLLLMLCYLHQYWSSQFVFQMKESTPTHKPWCSFVLLVVCK